MDAGFELLEHPSDIGVRAWGDTRERVLVEASKALTSIMVDPAGIEKRERRELHSTGLDAAGQVVAWLNELLFLFDAESLVFADFVIDSWTEAEIHGHAAGERFDPQRHEVRTAVKAATYHQFDLRRTEAGTWELRVFFDI